MFIEGITNVILDQQIDYKRLQLEHPIKRLQTRFYYYRNKKIEQAQKDLITKKLLEQFLKKLIRTEYKEILFKGTRAV